MKNFILSLCLAVIFLSIFVAFGWLIIPDYSRQGKTALINKKDTATIMYEEKEIPFIGRPRPRNITMQYKDSLGVYHTESFPEFQITDIKPIK